MEFEVCKDFADDIYYKMEKLQNGQIAGISFTHLKNKRSDMFYTSFAVADKRKSVKNFLFDSDGKSVDLLVTGKCGIHSLFWAKEMIKNFEKALIEEDIYIFSKKKTFILVGAENSRRYKVYKRGLRDLSYKEDFLLGEKLLKKEIIL